VKLTLAAIIALTIVLVLATTQLISIIKGPTRADLQATCLADSITAYPAWTQGQPNVTDTLPSCLKLTIPEREQLRETTAKFVRSALTNQARS
jgi:hypothetical protein